MDIQELQQGEEKLIYLAFTDADGNVLNFASLVEIIVLFKFNGNIFAQYSKTVKADYARITANPLVASQGVVFISSATSKKFAVGELQMEVAVTRIESASPTGQLTDITTVQIFKVIDSLYKNVT